MIAIGTSCRAGRADRGTILRVVLAVACLSIVGCSHSRKPIGGWAAITPNTAIAVAPALNFSGSADFDPVRIADILASELSQVPGVAVIGVNRVLAVLAEQGVDRIQSPEHALAVSERLGADAIIVLAVTEYDAYTPIVGIAAQMYGRPIETSQVDPVAASRMARPFPVVDDRGSHRPWSQSQRTFDSRQDVVRDALEDYAESRNGGGGPFGWKKYLASQEWYLRFCCNTVCRDLLEQSGRMPVTAVALREE